jgi:hypothetical protein
MLSVTGTVQFDLWENVISRVEARWDQMNDEDDIFASTIDETHFGVYLNVIYKF